MSRKRSCSRGDLGTPRSYATGTHDLKRIVARISIFDGTSLRRWSARGDPVR